MEYLGDAWWHGRHLIYLRAKPLRVDPQSGDLYLREGGRVLVELQSAQAQRTVVHRMLADEGVQRRDRAELLRAIDNPQDLDRFSPAPPLEESSSQKTAALAPSNKTPSILTGPYRYLVITRDALVPQFQRLAELREEQGLPSIVVSVEEIEANGRHGLDLAETIRLYLQDAYEKWGVDYVLLGGDTELIPTRYVSSTYYPPGGESQIPADFYYAGLDGNWNADGDATFGEPFVTGADPGDYCDFVPEVALGRAPVNTVEEATVFVDKVLAYESGANGDRFARALFGSEVLFPQGWQPGDPIIRDGASFSETLVASIQVARPGEYTLTRRYQNYTSYPGAVEETRAGILSDLNSGSYGLFHHIGHGFYYNMSVGDKNILVSDADALSNGSSTFVLIALNCDSAAFDFDCLLERFLRNPNGGAVACIGSSRAAFDNTTNSYQQALYKALFAARRQRLGDAILESRLGYAVDTFYNSVDRWTQLVYTLLGDPAMRMWTASPKAITVSAPSTVQVGSGPLAVTVNETQGGGVDSVAVVLRKAGESLVAGWTDASGQLSLPFAPKEAGSWTLYVNGRDVMPDSMTVEVTSATQVQLALAGFTLDDTQGNGNGIAEAGELVSILPTLVNGGQSPSAAGTLSLSSLDPGVTLVQDQASFSPVTGESSHAADSAFSVQLAAGLADATRLHFLVAIDEDGGAHFEDSFDLTLSGAKLEIVSLDLDDSSGNQDGILDPGEQVYLNFTLKNFGTARVDSVSGVLRALDSAATVIDSTAHWGLFDGVLSSQDNALDPFAVQESDTASPHLYRLLLSESSGATRSFEFDLRRPAMLTGLSPGLAQAGSVLLHWDPSSAADLLGYQVERRVKGESAWVSANSDLLQAGSVFLDEGLPDRTSFEYRVRAVDRAGLAGPASQIVTAVTPPPEVGCFPLPIDQETSGASAVGDVDGDGVLDLAVGSGHIYLIDGLCREKVDGDDNAQTFGPLSAVDGGFQPSGMSLGNLDQSGTDMQIVGENWTSHEIYVYNADGSLQSGWPQPLYSKAWTTAVLGDLDQDGTLEIVTNDISGYTYAFHMDGSEVADGDLDSGTKGPIAPRRDGESYGRTTPALYDVDGDGKLEILFGSKFLNGAPEYFYALKADGSGNAMGWPKNLGPGASFLASPAVGDLDNSGQMEIVAPCENDSLYVWEADGSRYGNFPVYLHARSVDLDSLAPSPALADFDGDGYLEIVAVSIDSRSEAGVFVFDHLGNVLPGWPQVVPGLSE
ncbi:MAG TPA: C25 family cysteine peptidase, partial [Candidatus Krumholzibacteria bacterium]|nr:C25 family cysteine peptidase [Candidatus Krumholzibacteria bacterium]